MKYCGKCQQTKEDGQFNRDRSRADGLQPVCRECTRAYWKAEYASNIVKHRARSKQRYWSDPQKEWGKSLKKNYGMTAETYAKMLAHQGGKCAICALPERVVGYRLSVDHCHTTGKVRGLLCKRCNVAIGLLNESASVIQNAAAYLEANHVL